MLSAAAMSGLTGAAEDVAISISLTPRCGLDVLFRKSK
jgi:hypothetical protein